MPIKAVELTSIEAKRFVRLQERLGQIKIDHNSTVTLVRANSPNDASVEFRYTANYAAVGIIKVEGALQWEGDATSLAGTWQKNGQMPPEIASEIHTTVMRVCLPQAVGIAKDLNLPPPIPLPQVRFEEPKKTSAAGAGPEIA
ncbi:MAG TPA: hypothetical protein VM681_01495 [Candidatus Thermoplasmatota archaeon]|nr:hypothetical protein [Candidatus Thermoplasmatota archaeon]